MIGDGLHCIAGWPMAPCGVFTGGSKICAMHRAIAEKATEHLSDEEIRSLWDALQVPLVPAWHQEPK